MRVLWRVAVVRIRFIDEQQRVDGVSGSGPAAAQQTAGNVGVERQPDIRSWYRVAPRRRIAACALQQQVADELRDAFHANENRRPSVGGTTERLLDRRLLLRVCRTGAQQQGDESKRKEQFAKICHFLLLVKM